MTRRSGYEVTIKAFLPCDVHLRGSVSAADRTIDCFLATMNGHDYECFLAVTETRKYRQRADVPDEPADDGPDGPTPAMREGIETHRKMTTAARSAADHTTAGLATGAGDATALTAVGAQVAAGVADNTDPEAPAGLRRTRAG